MKNISKIAMGLIDKFAASVIDYPEPSTDSFQPMHEATGKKNYGNKGAYYN